MLRTVWQSSPITALRFLSKSTILVGSANQLNLYDWIKNEKLCSWYLHNFVTIHNLDVCEDSNRNIFLVVLGGNRFYAAAYLRYSRTLGWKFDAQFTSYLSDNIVHCWAGYSDAVDWFCFVTAHGRTIVSRTFSDAPCDSPPVIESPTLDNSTCYSGLIKCHTRGNRLDCVSFVGSTFGQVRICASYFQFGLNHTQETIAHSTTMVRVLQCQKGAVFSLSFCELQEQTTVRLAAAAEDRSIAIWTTNRMKSDDNTSVPYELKCYCGSWSLLYLLKGGSLTESVLFESRIWSVLASNKGLLAVGEDCRIVWYPWCKMSQMKVLTGAHRGHGIWCVDLWFPKDGAVLDAVVVSGGNDGAVCLQPLIITNESHVDTCANIPIPHPCDFTQAEASLQRPISPSSSSSDDLGGPFHLNRSHRVVLTCSNEEGEKTDFPRCLFFGPEGRLFYVTELGHIYTLSISPQFTINSHHRVHPSFRLPVSAFQQSNGESSAEFDEGRDTSSDNNPGLPSLFCGYTVCATDQSYTTVTIGDRKGRIALLQILSESPYLVCSDLTSVEEKVMKLIWLNCNLLLVALQSGPAVLFSVQRDTASSVFSPPLATLHASTRSALCWISAACLHEQTGYTNENLSIIVTGTRDGGLYTFKIDLRGSNQNVNPTWSMQVCHGRGGCTALIHVPSTCVQSDLILSSGRTNGEVRLWQVNPDLGSLLLRSIIPNSSNLTWVERFHRTADGRLFALGFQSVNFKAYLLSSTKTSVAHSQELLNIESLNHPHGWFCTECGGGNRPWEWWTSSNTSPTNATPELAICDRSEGNFLNVSSFVKDYPNCAGDQGQRKPVSLTILATLNRGEVLVQWAWSRPDPYPYSIVPTYLRPNLHGRDINCCLAISCPISTNTNLATLNRNCSDLLFCFAGSEDTTLSSWAMSNDGRAKEEWNFIWKPEHHRGHMSNIRCITVPQVFCEGQHEPHASGDFLLTGGGRGQVCLWSLGLSLPNFVSSGSWRPGWLGFTRLRHTPPVEGEELGSVATGSWTVKTQKHPCATDLRVMALICLKLFSDITNEWLLALAACSDGSIRLLRVQPPTSSHPRNPIIFQLGSLEALSGCSTSELPRTCYLDIQLTEWNTPHSFLVVAGTSRGELRSWHVQLPSELDQLDHIDNWRVSLRYQLWVDPIAPFHLSTRPAINCLGSLDPITAHKQQKSLRLAVGLDDGSVRVVRLPRIHGSSGDRHKWLCSAVHHFATVVRLCVIQSNPEENMRKILTLSADQRVVCWQFDRRCDQLSPLQRAILPGLGDPHGMAASIAVYPTDFPSDSTQDSNPTKFILTTGIGSTILKLSDL